MVRIFNAALAFALFAMPTTAIPPTDAPTVLPKLILRADIPEAVQVFEHNATTHANALETRSLLGKRIQCINYTGYLNFSRTQRALASEKFTNGAYHCGYTQRTAGGCNAEFYCVSFNGNCILGSHIESQFDKIYTQLNCPTGGQYTCLACEYFLTLDDTEMLELTECLLLEDGGSFGCGSDYYGCGGGSVSVSRAIG
ncbi:uncharacterized protein RSE6_10383 [Rhynchosporium secalis]|uniref:Cyanovirin-N domain-containing protein n=1 Tax=Rhynchosporium secalis TaxID=38038 RepID=A0A1E1MKA2_RHYSE|nr:uncharacterized protein RSE6_10383 [Rhynchosporium secalis]